MTFRKALAFAAGILMFLYPLIAPAADDSSQGRWWQRPEVAERIGLTPAEKQTLDGLYMQKRQILFGLKSDVEKERIGLDNIMEQPRLNERAAVDQFRKLEKKRERLSFERFKYLIEVRKILGNERYQKLTSIEKERRAKRHGSRGGDLSPR